MAQGYDGLPSYYVQDSNPITPNLGLSLKGMDPILAENMVLIDTAVGGGGGGTSVFVNSVSVSNPNFNNVTPAAPLGFTNVLWQKSGSNVSAYVSSTSILLQTNQVNNDSQTVLNLQSGSGIDVTDNGSGDVQFSINFVIAQTKTAVASRWIRSYNAATGLFSATQPAFTDISGTAGLAQGGTNADLSATGGTSFVLRQSTVGAAITVSQLAFTDISGVATAAQIPSLDASKITTGQLALARGGTNADLSATGGTSFVLKQSSVGAAITVAQLAFTDISGTATAAQIPSLDASKITTGQLALARGGTGVDLSASGGATFVLAQDASHVITARALIAADIPSLDASKITTGILALANGGNTFAALGDLIYGGAAAAPTVLSGNITSTKKYLSQTGSGAASAAPAWAQINYADITGTTPTPPSGAVLWSALGNAAGALSLSNAGNATTFNQTSAVTWSWLNTTAATSSVSQSSPLIKLGGRYWTGAADAEDSWTIENVVANGTNGTSILDLVHAGTTGNAFVRIPAGTLASASAWGLNFTGTTVGLAASGSVIALVTTNTYPTIRFYNGATLKATLSTFSSSSIDAVSLVNSSATACITVESNLSTTVTQAGISLVNVSSFAGTGAGTQYGVAVGNPSAGTVTNGTITFAPASGATNFVGLIVRPVINQTGTSSGNYTGLLVNVVETALKGSTNLLLDLQAGATGGTSQLSINNSGVATKYAATALVSQGIPSEIVTVDLTAQSAAIVATTLISAPATGMYRVSWSADITTAATTSSVLGGTNGFQVVFTSPTDSVVKTTVVGNSVTSAANTTGTAVGGSFVVYAKTGTNIQYQYDYTSVGGTAMVYELHIKLERL